MQLVTDEPQTLYGVLKLVHRAKLSPPRCSAKHTAEPNGWSAPRIFGQPTRFRWQTGRAPGAQAIFTSLRRHQHELVHAVLGELPAVDAFINEGMAEAVAGSQRSDPDIAAARAMLGADQTREVDYGVAGRVPSYFIAEYSINGLQELWTAAPQRQFR